MRRPALSPFGFRQLNVVQVSPAGLDNRVTCPDLPTGSSWILGDHAAGRCAGGVEARGPMINSGEGADD